jgi:hypothetical protein
LKGLLPSLLLIGLCIAPARADDGGAWMVTEYRLPIVNLPPRLPRFWWRVLAETRLSADLGGLYQQYLRTGPVFEPTDWLFVPVHATIYADKLPDGRFEQEARLEVEPTFNWRIWKLTFADRNRLESRWRPDQHTRLRYRNQFRINYAPKGARFIPFVWDEVLFDLTDGFNENRFTAGLAFMIQSNVRLDVGYLLRTRKSMGEWSNSHFALLNMVILLPSKPKAK